MRTITANGGTYDAKKWLEEYIAFMTTPGSHNDTYAETYHRDFFLNFSKGEAPENCSKPVGGHNLAHVGSLNVCPYSPPPTVSLSRQQYILATPT